MPASNTATWRLKMIVAWANKLPSCEVSCLGCLNSLLLPSVHSASPAQPSPAACRPDSNKLNVQIILFLELHDTALITSLSFIFSDSAVYCYRYFFLFLPFILKRKQLLKALWMWIKDIDTILRVKIFNFCFFNHLHANHLSLLFPERRHNFVEESSKRHQCNVSKYF